MTIKIVKPGSLTARPLASCPLLVDESGLLGPKK